VNTLARLSFLSVASLSACVSSPPKPVSPPPVEKVVEVVPESKPLPALPSSFTQKGVTVKIDGLSQAPDGAILGVNGTAKNVTASDLRFCQISFSFLDQAGVKLDDAKATTKSLKSAQVWHFQAIMTHPSQSSYASILPEKVIAIPVKTQNAELASLK
jgi:hypothetical protein